MPEDDMNPHEDKLPKPTDPSYGDSMDILEGKKRTKAKGSGGGDDNNPLSRIESNFERLTTHIVDSKTKWYARIPKVLWVIAIAFSIIKAGPELVNRINDAQEKRMKAEIKARVGDRMYYDEGNAEAALKFYEEAIKINESKIEYAYKKTFVENMILLQKLLNLRRDYTKQDIIDAKMSLAKGLELIELEPDKSDAYVLQGQAYIVLGKTNKDEYNKGIDALNIAINLDPDNDFAMMRLGVAYQERGQGEKDPLQKSKDYSTALGYYRQSIYLNHQKVITKLKEVLGENYISLIEKSFRQKVLTNKLDTINNFKDEQLTYNHLSKRQKERGKTRKDDLGNLDQWAYEALQKNESTILSFLKSTLKENYQEFLGLYFMDTLNVKSYKAFYQYVTSFGIPIDLARVMDSFKYILAMNKKSKWANLWMGLAYQALHQYDMAIKTIQKALRKDPQFDLAYVNLGGVYLAKRPQNTTKAIKYFIKASKINPSLREAYFSLALAYGYQDKYERSLDFYKRAIQLDPDYLRAYEFRGLTYQDMGFYKKAVKDYSKALSLALRPGRQKAALYIGRGQAYHLMGDHHKAFNDLNASLELLKDNPVAYYYLANLFLSVAEYDKAVKNYHLSLQFNPKYQDVYYKLGRLYQKLNQSDKASEDLNEAIKLNPKSDTAYLARGRLFQTQGQLNKALNDYNQVVEMAPGKAHGFIAKAKVYQDQRQYQKAIDNYTKALNINPKHINVLKSRAKVYAGMNKKRLVLKDTNKIKALEKGAKQ